MKCPICQKDAKFIRDRGFNDGSGIVYMCTTKRCGNENLYIYRPIQKQTMKTQKLKITVWKDKKSEYRWNMKRCGRIVAESGEGYKRIKSCVMALRHILDCLVTLNYSWSCPTK